jgi:hypothetical protein
MGLIVPAAAFKISTISIAAHLWLGCDIVGGDIISEVKGEGESVYCDCSLSGEVLQVSCKEGLREEKTRDPIDIWSATTNPVGEESDTCIAVFNPGCEWLE